MNSRNTKRVKRHKRLRVKVVGTKERPRLAVFRSNTALYVQLINDQTGKTLFGMKSKGKTIEVATKLGHEMGKEAGKHGVTTVVFDRGGYLYHGRVRAFAQAVREEGIIF